MLKILLSYAVLLGFMFVSTLASHGQTARGADEVEELIALSNEWMLALERKDRNRLEQILHPDFSILGIGDDRAPTDRERWLQNGLEVMDWSDFRYDHFDVAVFGDVAVVRSTLDFTVRRRTGLIRKVATASPLVDVWVRRDGEWQIIRRYAAPWTARRWADRGVGFLAGAALLFIWLVARRFLRRRKAAGAKS